MRRPWNDGLIFAYFILVFKQLLHIRLFKCIKLNEPHMKIIMYYKIQDTVIEKFKMYHIGQVATRNLKKCNIFCLVYFISKLDLFIFLNNCNSITHIPVKFYWNRAARIPGHDLMQRWFSELQGRSENWEH
jgi:hypothetical protein